MFSQYRVKEKAETDVTGRTDFIIASAAVVLDGDAIIFLLFLLFLSSFLSVSSDRKELFSASLRRL